MFCSKELYKTNDQISKPMLSVLLLTPRNLKPPPLWIQSSDMGHILMKNGEQN